MNWALLSEETSTASSPLDTPELSGHNTPSRHSTSSLSSLEEDKQPNNPIPFPELEVPELDIRIPPLKDQQACHRTKTVQLTSISTVPDYDLGKFFTLSQPKKVMPIETPQIFHGDGRTSENPVDFLKSFNRAMRQQSIADSNDKLDMFSDYLRTSLQAERWFKAIPSKDRATWNAFVAAVREAMATSKDRREDKSRVQEGVVRAHPERRRHREEEDALRQRMLDARSMGNEGIAAHYWMQVGSKLPDIVKDLLKDEEYSKWEEFTKAVTKLKGSQLIEKQEQHLKQAQELRALCTDLARVQTRTPQQNPIAALQSQFNRMSINSTTPVITPTSNSAYSRVPVPANRWNTQSMYSHQPATVQQPLVIMEETRPAVMQLVQAMPQQPDSTAGRTAYAAQLAQWNTKWGESAQVTQETGYPLRPGTAAIALSKCFACGTHGHNRWNCPVPQDHEEQLICKEAVWRVIVSKVLGAYNRATATPISLIINEGYEDLQLEAWIEEIPECQGKADGSM
ncbi:hypothetical protein F4604DRAFT_1915376 [Suillus subluteus]|nr:hypothetical protein F4604DRAFT_1915376 [Suillus subluteus]